MEIRNTWIPRRTGIGLKKAGPFQLLWKMLDSMQKRNVRC